MTLSEGTDTLLQWGLQTGFMVSLLIGLVLIIRRPFARHFGANAAYALWLLPVIRLFMPQITVPFLRKAPTLEKASAEIAAETPLKAFGKEAASHAGTPRSSAVEAGALGDKASSSDSWSRASEGASDVTSSTINTDSVTSSLTSSAISSSPVSDTSASNHVGSYVGSLLPSVSGFQILCAVWIGVAVLWFGFQLYKQIRFSSVMREKSQEASDTLSHIISKATDSVGLSHTPDIRLSEYVAGPMVSGVVKPLIILPHDFQNRFDDAQQHFALVHEMAHIKRKDLWVAFASLAFRALFWPNPLVHYAAHKLRVDQEAACDASVIAWTGGETSTHSYAQTLVYAAKGMAADTRKTRLRSTPLGLALSDTRTGETPFNQTDRIQSDFDEETKA